MQDFLDNYFEITARGSSIGTEVRAGIASFLTVSYVILVNPQILSLTSVPSTDSVFATCLSSAVGSILCGVVGNLPFALAPGMGLSAYLVYGLVLGDVLTLPEALTSVLISGVLQIVFAITGVSKVVMGVVPRGVKMAIVVGMGILVSMIGMVSVKLVVKNDKTLVGMGDLADPSLLISLAGLILIATLVNANVKGGILIGITILTLTFWYLEDEFPTQIMKLPTLEYGPSTYLDLSILSSPSSLQRVFPAVAAFVFIGIFDVSGVMFGLAALGGLMKENTGYIPGSLWGFIGSGIGTIVAGGMGSSPVIVTVECAAGIKEGGRTGLTAVVVGALFLASLFFSPLLGSVPQNATAPVLMLVGSMMMGECRNINWDHTATAVPAFLTIVMMPLTYSITNGIVFGLVSAGAFYFTTGQFFGDIKNMVERREREQERGERNGLLGGGEEGFKKISKNPSFTGEETVVRKPSFLLNEEDIEKIKELERGEGGKGVGGGNYGTVQIG
ncbi:hypothetical protein TrRE_jg12044 [Triparma retinervis]|uniref:Uncharacterized protein n=1 Tax=Triparma retinervis TaxID=2557542 RepID=A0A9W6Z8M6_9STRA|nr:hypothetical protein TrRE_jg12044 [Triparma retinervis]